MLNNNSWNAGVVELWAFLGRFAEVLGLSQVPTVEDLEEGLTQHGASRSTTMSALVSTVPASPGRLTLQP
jgi:hypothetical protein